MELVLDFEDERCDEGRVNVKFFVVERRRRQNEEVLFTGGGRG